MTEEKTPFDDSSIRGALLALHFLLHHLTVGLIVSLRPNRDERLHILQAIRESCASLTTEDALLRTISNRFLDFGATTEEVQEIIESFLIGYRFQESLMEATEERLASTTE